MQGAAPKPQIPSKKSDKWTSVVHTFQIIKSFNTNKQEELLTLHSQFHTNLKQQHHKFLDDNMAIRLAVIQDPFNHANASSFFILSHAHNARVIHILQKWSPWI